MQRVVSWALYVIPKMMILFRIAPSDLHIGRADHLLACWFSFLDGC